MNNPIVELLKMAPKGQVDDYIAKMISAWPKEPSPIQILEVLDQCIYYASSSDLVVMVLQTLYNEALQRENIAHVDVAKLAHWRTK